MATPDSSTEHDAPFLRHAAWIAATVVMGLVAAAIFGAIHAQGIRTDIPQHTARVIPMFRDGVIVGNALFYVLAWLVSGLTEDPERVLIAGYAVLTAAVVLRFVTSAAAARRFGATLVGSRRATLLAIAFVLALQVAFSLPAPPFSAPGPIFFPGPLPPNVWHNSTTIVLMPIAILAHVQTVQFLGTGTWRDALVLAALVSLSVVAKPSYFMAWLPSFVVLSLVVFKMTPNLGRAAVGAVIPGLVLVAQFVLIYEMKAGNVYFEELGESDIVVRPFAALLKHMQNPPLALLATFAFPVTFAVLRWRDVIERREVLLAYLCLCVAVVEGVLLYETGPRAPHGNLLWGINVGSFLVFLFAGTQLLRRLAEPRASTWRDRVVVGVFAAHVLSGIAYLGWGLVVKARLFWV